MAGEQHLYLVVGGTYENAADSAEIWQFGVRLALVFGTIDDQGVLPSNWTVTPDARTHTSGNWDTVTQFAVDGPGLASFDPQSWMEDFAQPTAEALWSTGTISTQAKLTFLKLSPIDDSGHVVLKRTCESTANTDIHGTDSGALLPLQDSVCVSLRTPVIGPRGRGRFFLPPVSTSIMGTYGHIDPSWQGDVVTNAKAFLEGLTYSGTGSGDAHVHTIVTGAPWTHYGAVTTVEVGDIMDTQRRRRNAMTETYLQDSVDL